MTDDSQHPALRLAETQRTLVFATADPAPWSAPVYYLYFCGKFYFFSSAESRHVRSAISAGHCAASIYRDSDNWQDIEGLQMDGTICHVEADKEALAVLVAYVAKFPTVNDLFREPQIDLGLTGFRKLFRAELYAFNPTRVFYLNNRNGFASRRDITTVFGS